MINLANHAELTVAERKRILNRALNAVPFFNYMPFEVVNEAVKRLQYDAKTDINLDFFLTEMRSNFGEVFDVTNSLFNLNVYSAFLGRSVYGFNRSEPLPVSQLTTEARFDTLVANQVFEDRQRESFPYLIEAGERIIAEIINLSAKSDPIEAGLALVGFNILRYPYLNNVALEKINQSLEKREVYQTFRIKVDHDGIKFYNFENDATPRLILGIGVVNDSADKAEISASNIQIEDTTRHLKLTNRETPVQFIAPRLSCVLDTHSYLFPIEYFFEPFGNLRFRITNEFPPLTEFGYEMVILTRTV